MAQFCLKCWNKLNGTNDPPKKFIISKDLDLCEGCGKLTRVILLERKYAYLHTFRWLVVLLKILYAILFVFRRILTLPYLLYKRKIQKNKGDKP